MSTPEVSAIQSPRPPKHHALAAAWAKADSARRSHEMVKKAAELKITELEKELQLLTQELTQKATSWSKERYVQTSHGLVHITGQTVSLIPTEDARGVSTETGVKEGYDGY